MTTPSNPHTATETSTPPITTLEALVNDMCFCKLRTHCPDKTSADCLKEHKAYSAFMLQHHTNCASK